jgi:TolB-like protein/DNA-binding winged helix-turn-helix (wHTH) protein/Tfp pilus assembly protein PilF
MSQTPSGISEVASEIFIAGDLHVDVGQQCVTRAGIKIPLPYLSFQLLLALIRAAPNILSNDLLIAQVWPGSIVSPETVAKRVNLLREALGDNAQEPRYIAGVRNRGYRLVATVSPAPRAAPLTEVRSSAPVGVTQPDPSSTQAATAIEPQPGATKPSRKWWLAVPVLLVAIAAIVIGVRTVNHARVADAQPTPQNLREPAAIGARARTVAVLPFDNLSADVADSYLAQGLPEMVLNRLSRIDGLSVIARNSSFALSTKNIDSSEIGQRLNSGYLISGSVQRQADRLRVAVQLVDATASTLIWSAHFDRDLHDIFNVEDEIADQIADALSARVGELEPKPAASAHSANLEAYLTFLQGRTLLGRFTVAESEAAVPYFERAIALDPNFAAAYASLYDARMQAADQRREDLRPVRARYRHLIDRALQLDPKLGAAYFARAMWADEPVDASATPDNPLVVARDLDFRQGAALDPSNGRGLEAYAQFLADYAPARVEESRSVLKRALWVDPMSPRVRLTDVDTFSLNDSGVRVAEKKLRQVLELDPNFVPALLRYGQWIWIVDGKLAEAIQIIEHAIALDPKNPWLRHRAMGVYLDLGDVQAARAVVASLPQSARDLGFLSMYENDWRRAGLAAYDEESWARGEDECEVWQHKALRDYALKTGELRRAIAFIKSKYYDLPAAILDICNFDAAVDLSQLFAAAGQSDQAAALRRAVSSWIDANEAKYLGEVPRAHAEILLLDGKPDAALAQLAEAFRSGFYVQWWYTLNHDPLWKPLHGDARFQAIAADVRRYVDEQRSQLEALRQQGVVPRRTDPVAAQ